MEKALAVANDMIQRGINANTLLTQMRLQKLIYFAHGWHLALYDAPLVDTTFQAWKYGPVIPSVYHEFKEYGTLGINSLGTELVMLPEGGMSWYPPQIVDSTGLVKPLLDKIWEVFGSYSGTQLSGMTHAEGSPWRTIYDANQNGRDMIIPNDDIKQYFKGLMNK